MEYPKRDMTQIGTRIRQLREQRGVTQEHLAFCAGLALRTVSRAERGRYRPTLSTLVSIAAALDTTVERLLAPPDSTKAAS